MPRSQQTPAKPESQAKTHPRNFTKRWSFAVDELLDSDTLALEIDSPDIYLTFELADNDHIQKALVMLASATPGERKEKAARKFNPSSDELVLGHFGHANVYLLKDDEEPPRFFLVVGGKSKFKVRVSLEGDRIREFTEALHSAVCDESILHFPVYFPVRGSDEFLLVKVNDEMSDCLPIFTSRELAELYILEEGSRLNLFKIDDRAGFTQFARDMMSKHGVRHYAINFTFSPTSVKCGPLTELLEG